VNGTVLTVLMVEDHEMVASALADILRAESDLQVVGVTGTAAEALQVLRERPVDVVLLDLRLADGEDATALIPDVAATSPSTKVLVLSAWSDDWSVARAVEAGCHGYLLKEQAVSELVAAIRAIARGEAVFAPSVLSRVLKLLRPGTATTESLTARETEVLQRLADGAATEQIAADLFVSVNTVRNHVHNIIRKLNVHSRLEAVASGIRNGLIQVHR
jgi:DNA-binding NarL/FixJ family response regulator